MGEKTQRREGEITADGCTIFMESIEHGGSVTMGGPLAEAENEVIAQEIARRCEAFKLLMPAAVEALAWIEERSKGFALDVKDSLRVAIRSGEES